MLKELEKRFHKLEQTRLALFEKLKELDSSYLNKKPDAESWSISQVLYHLYNAESLSLGYVQKKMQNPSRSKKSGIGDWFRFTSLRLAFVIPAKWKAPPLTAQFPANINPKELFNSYSQTRSNWRDTLEKITPEILPKQLFKHQVVGRMNLMQALDFMQIHFDRHQKQIDRIRTKLDPKTAG